MILDAGLVFAVDLKSRHWQFSLMAARFRHPGGEGNTVEAQMVQATSVLHQGQFLDRNAQQAESGYARRAAQT